jgi:alpha-glucosidase
MCAEAWVLPLSRIAKWVRPDEYHQTFNFGYLESPWEKNALVKVVSESLEAFGHVGGISTWVLSNHDVIRHASRYGFDKLPPQGVGIGPDNDQPDEQRGQLIARAATAFMLGLPGGAYLFQGEELGLPEHTTLEGKYRQDPSFFRTNGERVGRDGCRVPLPWEAGVNQSNGFSSTGASWLPQPEIYKNYSRDLQEGVSGSTLEMYKQALALRSELDLGQGSFEWDQELSNKDVLAFRNHDVLVIHNFGEVSIDIPEGQVLIASATDSQENKVLPHETKWLRL